MKKRIRFIINPISGVGKKNILPALIETHLDHSVFTYDIVFTEYRGHAAKISKDAADNGFNIVCVAGGDGSVNEAGTALINRDTALAILPTGSGNGIARHLGLSMRLKKALRRINLQKFDTIDTVTLNGKHFIGVSGFGFDAMIAKKFDEYHSRGLISYVRLVLREFKNYKGISVVLNEDKEYSNLLFCSVANTSQFGNGFYISPQSDVKDGDFEIVLVSMPKTLGFIRLLIASLIGTVHHSKYVKCIQTDNAQIRVNQCTSHIDGEPIELKNLLVQLNCHPKSLSVII
ncbi:MAG TPA: diacylglycerol kinase family protein [Brumimicrobium sp.]|nr:diacylglycerol kinase family protein [Brumimicrobium sp.]